jgi:hypothetical protein
MRSGTAGSGQTGSFGCRERLWFNPRQGETQQAEGEPAVETGLFRGKETFVATNLLGGVSASQLSRWTVPPGAADERLGELSHI